MKDYSNNLIFGADKTEKIVSVEPKDDTLFLFKEIDGKIEIEKMDAIYWFMTNQRISSKQEKLEGNQYYKYIATFDSLEKQREIKTRLYRNRLDYYDIYDPVESNMVINGITYYKGLEPSEVSALSFDIESDGLVKHKNSEIYLITNTFRKLGQITKKTFSLEDFHDQKEMINSWCSWVRAMNPSIILGHNIYGYDFGYLDHVAKLWDTELKLGRDGSAIKFNEKVSEFRKDGSQSYEYFNAHIYGREIVDTFFLSIKYDVVLKQFVSYGLKPIIKQLGMEKEDRVFVDASKIREYYYNRINDPEPWLRAKSYASDDSDDALKLYDLMAPSYFYATQSISKPFQAIINGATGSQINNMMVRAYLQNGHSIAKTTEAEKFPGAISFGVPGIYSNAFKVDVASLYPSIMRQYKIYDHYKDPNHFFLELVETFTLERLKNKKLAKETGLKYYNDLQEAQKILINSMYGFLGAPGLNYNSPQNAALVTAYGREVLEKSVVFATGNNVLYWKEKAGIEVEIENEN